MQRDRGDIQEHEARYDQWHNATSALVIEGGDLLWYYHFCGLKSTILRAVILYWLISLKTTAGIPLLKQFD